MYNKNHLPSGHSKDVLIEPRKKLSEKSLQDLLKNCGLKITNQRLAILRALNSGLRVHMTARDILDEVKKEIPFIGFATVYRFIKKLQSQGVLTEISMGSGSSKYELKSNSFHYHISCVKCGKIVEFKDDNIETILENIVEKNGFTMEHQILELYVHCNSQECSSRPQ